MTAGGISCTCIALLALSGCGPREEPVDLLLADLVGRSVESRRAAARQLAELKPPRTDVTAALKACLTDADRDVRRLACYALGEFGTVDAAVLAPLLEDQELSVRLAAAYALLKIEPAHQTATEVLSAAMKLGDGGVIVAIGRQGPRAEWAVPTLTQLLRDRRPGIRRLAAESLGRIGPSSESALPALQQAQHDPDDRVRASATAAINRIGQTETPSDE